MHPTMAPGIDQPMRCCSQYIVQDHKYLVVYGAVLNALAARADSREVASFFTTSALNILGGEMELHTDLLHQWNLSEEDVVAVPMQPACLMYSSYLQAIVSSRPFFEGVAMSRFLVLLHCQFEYFMAELRICLIFLSHSVPVCFCFVHKHGALQWIFITFAKNGHVEQWIRYSLCGQ
jgi:hypothetical protein